MQSHTVEFVFSDEATPREIHTRTVKAESFADARETVEIQAILGGDRVMTLEAGRAGDWN